MASASRSHIPVGFTDLPPELLQGTLEAIVCQNSLYDAMNARFVCKSFNTGIFAAICTTRALENPNSGERGVMYTGTHFLTEYLYVRTINDRDCSLYYTKIIKSTVDSILEFQGRSEDEQLRQEYIRKLCRATATRSYGPQSQTIESIYKFLNPRHPWILKNYAEMSRHSFREHTPSENVLAAASYLNLTPLIEKLIREKTPEENTYFGRPLSNAILNNSKQNTLSLLQTVSLRHAPKYTLPQNVHRGEELREYAIYLTASTGNTSLLHILLSPSYFHQGGAISLEFALWSAYRVCIARAAWGGHLETIKSILNLSNLQETYDTAMYAYEAAYPHQAPTWKPFEHTSNPAEPRYTLYNSMINEAAARGHIDVVKFGLDGLEGLRVIERDTHSEALEQAIEGDHLQTVTLLLERRVSPEPFARFITPLGIAISKGHLEIVKIMIHYGAKVNLTSAMLKEPFETAVKEGRVELVRFLMGSGFVVDEKFGRRMFFIAKRLGWEEFVGEFERFGVGVNGAVGWEMVEGRLKPLYE